MLGSSEATSEHSLSIHLESGDNKPYPSGYEYVSDDRSGSEKESSADSPSEGEGEASLLGCGYKKLSFPESSQPDKWDSIDGDYDHAWGLLDKSELEVRKNMQAEIRKVVAFRTKSGGSSVPPMKNGQKRKQPMDKG
nr:hypothetical protein CFP56_28049 [Quercus suber]